MRKHLLFALPLMLILAFWGFNHWFAAPSSDVGDAPAQDMSRLSAAEIGKQSKAAIIDMIASEKPEVISRNAELLRQLAMAPVVPRADAVKALELIAALEKGRLTLLSQLFSLRQERDSLQASMQQGNLAIEMTVAPMVGSDAYLAGIYQQYKGYSETISLVMKSLFAETSVEAQQVALARLQGMAPTAIDNVRVLSLEISALHDNAQAKAGLDALQRMIIPEQGCIARWIWMQSQSAKLQALAEELQSQMSFH
jgi:hypothetical protein